MATEVKSLSATYKINYLDAVVAHTDKYNDNVGLNISFFIFNTVVQEVVFRLPVTGTDYKAKIYNGDLDFYVGKEVKLIVVDDKYVVGYIDVATKRYYYITSNISRDLRKTISIIWVILLTIILLVVLFSLRFQGALYVVFLPVLYWLYEKALNYRIKKRIDKVLQQS